MHKLLILQDFVLDVGAPWCGPCRAYAKPFGKVADTFRDYASFGRFDIEYKPDNSLHAVYRSEGRKILKRLVMHGILKEDIKTIPTTIFFKNGKEVYRLKGYNRNTIDKLESKIQALYSR